MEAAKHEPDPSLVKREREREHVACPSTASKSTANQPTAGLAATSSGRTSASTSNVIAAATSIWRSEENRKSGSTAADKARARAEPRQAARTQPRSPVRNDG